MMAQGSIPCGKRIGIGDRMKKVNLDELAAALEQTDVLCFFDTDMLDFQLSVHGGSIHYTSSA